MAQQDRTEQATPKRRKDFRERGQVAFSRDAAMVAGLLGALVAGHFTLSGTVVGLQEAMRDWVGRAAAPRQAWSDPRALFLHAASDVGAGCGAVLMAVGVAGVGLSVVQTGGLWSWKAIEVDWNRVDPAAGLKRLVSLRAAVEAAKALAKAALLAVAAGMALWPWIPALPGMLLQPLGDSVDAFGQAVSKLLAVACALLGVLAALDYLYQRWSMDRQMRMTRQEVMDDHKEEEGNPHVRRRRGQVHRQLVTGNRLVAAVADADVVITNPDHVAVALAYVLGRHRAPVVTAMGVDARAERIKALAREKGVPRVENRPLARLLLASTREG